MTPLLRARLGTNAKRIARGLAAQGYSQAVTIALQIISIPVLLHSWGVTLYGAWVVLTTIPTYLGLADLGFAQIAANEMTMLTAARNYGDALRIFQSTLLFVGAICTALAIAAIFFVSLAPVARLFSLPLAPEAIRTILLLLTAQTLLTIASGVIGAALRAEGRISHATQFYGTARLLDGASLLGVALSGGSMVTAAAAMLACRSVATACYTYWVVRTIPWLRLGVSAASRSTAASLAIPSLTFMGYTLGNMVAIQGTTLVTAAQLGPTAVAAVSTARTLGRFGVTASNAISYTLQPEYSAIFGRRDVVGLTQYMRRHVRVALALAAGFLAVALPSSHFVLTTWTRHKIHVIEPLLSLLILASALEMLWSSLQTPLVAASRHKSVATFYLAASCASVASLHWLLPFGGINAIGWTSISLSAAMVAAILIRSKSIFPEGAWREASVAS